MNEVGSKERITQNRIINLFKDKLGYEYLGDWQDRENNSNIEEEILRRYLSKKKRYNETLIKKAIHELKKVSEDQSKTLYEINKNVYSYLRYGINVKETPGKPKETIFLIDWKKPENNIFGIAEEVTIVGQNTKRPDIVLYINGIALGVLELKRSTISVSEGIRQNLDNQDKRFIQSFFNTIQLIMAGNDTEGLRYGVIETPEKYYLTWKEKSDFKNKLDKDLALLCNKHRFLEIIHDFIVFDRGKKKICRHNQYFAVKASQEKLRKREGGIIWHTQGSGKSMIMVWLAKWIYEHIKNSRVVIITDRIELDKQIEKVFKGVNEEIKRAKSGRDLVNKLNQHSPWLICSLVHKFANKEEADFDSYIEDITKYLPRDFKPKGDIYVFVDECHRTQSGELHKAMKQILPNAILIGFTGTPLLKADKLKSIDIFGQYIHTYKFDEAVADKVILDLRYEARNIDQLITSPDKIDQWFEAKTKGLTEYARTILKSRWGTMQKVLSSRTRLEKIVNDIMLDMGTKDRLSSGYGNAMLIAGSIYEACKYYELFQNAGLKKCAIVTSYVPGIDKIKGESTGDDEVPDEITKYEIYNKMLNGKKVEDFEEEVKEKFVNEPAQMKLLIVVDKLLTGFDAPPATYLYIDKHMQDHGLFQAICRVNRLDTDDKDYGYIIDYMDLFKSLEKAVIDYTGEAFGKYDKADVEGLLKDRLSKAKEDLDNALESIKALCEPVPPPKDTAEHIKYFCGDAEDKEDLLENEPKRLALYKMTSSLVRAYANIANEMEEAGYSKREIEKIKDEVTHFENVRMEVKLASSDYIDLKVFEPAMRHLIDAYISASESKLVTSFGDLTLVELIINKGLDAFEDLPENIKNSNDAVAETIENNLRKVIIDENPTNPKYYEKMSTLLEELIRERKAQTKSYEEYLKKIIELTKMIKKPETTGEYPENIDTKAKRALYDNLERDADLAEKIHLEVLSTRKDGFRGNLIKEREVKYAIKKYIDNDNLAEIIFEIIKKHDEY